MHSPVRQGCDRDHADSKEKRGKPLGKPRFTLGNDRVRYVTRNWLIIPCRTWGLPSFASGTKQMNP